VKTTRRVLICCATVLLAACTRQVGGLATLPFDETPGPLVPLVVDVDQILLDQQAMRAITGGGDDLNIIPTMDGKQPVDIDQFSEELPTDCRFVFAETATFGSDVADFHKTTFQYPPGGGLISEGAAVYRDTGAARHAFDRLVSTVQRCGSESVGRLFVGDWTAGEDSLQIRPGGCGRDYRLKSAVLIEVTFCSFPDSVPDIVMTSIAAKVPGG
jgi:PknH-like extracellular domain